MIDSQEFNQQLQNGDHTLNKTYLFFGQASFLSEESAQHLVNIAKANGFSQREIFYIDNRSKFQAILNAMQSPGLFDPKKIIELRFDTDKPTKKIGEQILTIAHHQSPNLLIIQAGNLPYRIQKEKWFSQIQQSVIAVIAKPIYANQLPNWIHQRARQLGLKLQTPALQRIMHFSEGNLLWTNQILMQLSHSDYPQPIGVDIIDTMLADLSVFQIEDLTRTVLSKDDNALKILQKLEQENESLVLITSVLFKEFDTIIQIIQSGLPFNQACQQLRIWQSKQRQYQTALNFYELSQCQHFIQQLAQLDKINKGLDKGDGWLLLTNSITQLLVKQ